MIKITKTTIHNCCYHVVHHYIKKKTKKKLKSSLRQSYLEWYGHFCFSLHPPRMAEAHLILKFLQITMTTIF